MDINKFASASAIHSTLKKLATIILTHFPENARFIKKWLDIEKLTEKESTYISKYIHDVYTAHVVDFAFRDIAYFLSENNNKFLLPCVDFSPFFLDTVDKRIKCQLWTEIQTLYVINIQTRFLAKELNLMEFMTGVIESQKKQTSAAKANSDTEHANAKTSAKPSAKTDVKEHIIDSIIDELTKGTALSSLVSFTVSALRNVLLEGKSQSQEPEAGIAAIKSHVMQLFHTIETNPARCIPLIVAFFTGPFKTHVLSIDEYNLIDECFEFGRSMRKLDISALSASALKNAGSGASSGASSGANATDYKDMMKKLENIKNSIDFTNPDIADILRLVPDIPDSILDMLPSQIKTIVKMILRKVKSKYKIGNGSASGVSGTTSTSGSGGNSVLRDKLRANIASKRAKKGSANAKPNVDTSTSTLTSTSTTGSMHQLSQKHFEYRVDDGNTQKTTTHLS